MWSYLEMKQMHHVVELVESDSLWLRAIAMIATNMRWEKCLVDKRRNNYEDDIY